MSSFIFASLEIFISLLSVKRCVRTFLFAIQAQILKYKHMCIYGTIVLKERKVLNLSGSRDDTGRRVRNYVNT